MLKLTVQERDAKASPKSFLKKGLLPAVFYGPKEKSQAIAMDKIAFVKAWREAGESTVIVLETPKGEIEALVREVSCEPVKGEPVHVDFYVPEKGKKVTVPVPLEFVGISSAIKDLGGTLVKVLHEIEVEALPKDLPHGIKIDIAALKDLDAQILAQDISLPVGVALITEPEEVVAAVSVAQEEKEETGPIDISTIEVEKKGKKEEEGKE
ncbi:MAG: 50S ribosomal protein L25 [Parcubacteria group bacterium]|nr:50S ribosomal protein L25 [Parcubacteria group bacterium]